MRHFPAPLSHEQSDALVDRIEAGFDEYGYGLWALEPAGGGELLGFTGLQAVSPALPFAPATEMATISVAGANGSAGETACKPVKPSSSAAAERLQRPQPIAVLVESGLDAVNKRVALLVGERGREVARRLGVRIERGEWRAVD